MSCLYLLLNIKKLITYLIALTIHLTLPRLTFALPCYHASKETEIKQTL